MPSGIASANQTYTIQQLVTKFAKTPSLANFVMDLSQCVYASTTGQYIVYCVFDEFGQGRIYCAPQRIAAYQGLDKTSMVSSFVELTIYINGKIEYLHHLNSDEEDIDRVELRKNLLEKFAMNSSMMEDFFTAKAYIECNLIDDLMVIARTDKFTQ